MTNWFWVVILIPILIIGWVLLWAYVIHVIHVKVARWFWRNH